MIAIMTVTASLAFKLFTGAGSLSERRLVTRTPTRDSDDRDSDADSESSESLAKVQLE